MQRGASHTYPQTMASQPRYTTAHSTSSAFSASANPNEDWTKISDLAERRRIQNRIAQRNYRKKLKRRLEDLERRAGSSSASPEAQHSELASIVSSKDDKSRTMTRESSKHSIGGEAPQLSPEILPLDEHSVPFDTSRSFSLSSTAFTSYPPTTSYLQHEYQHSPSYHTAQQNYFYEYQYPTDYSQSLPPTLPTMLPTNYATKQEPVYGEDDLMNSFSMNYASLAGLGVPSSQAYASPSSQSHTPSLSDSYTFNISPQHSPNYFDLPLTPVSRTATPSLHMFDITCN